MPSRSTAYLDSVRLRLGNDGLRRTFYSLAESDRERAVGHINHDALRFPTLFALRGDIVKHDLGERMNERNRCALNICEGVLSGTSKYGCDPNDIPKLRWILGTGLESAGMGDAYDEVMDKTALFLTRVHGDKSAMEAVEELMFLRHRRGGYHYDLVWAYFESSCVDDLMHLARRLRSPDRRDVELASRLFNFIPGLAGGGSEGRVSSYRVAVLWLKANRRRLYYTGESDQMHPNPRRYALRGETPGVEEARI